MYTPTRDDLVSVIQLLHHNGVEVSNSKTAYAELKQYETNPSFCVLLSTVFGASENPIADFPLPVGWPQYRQLAGITLKNNLGAARHALGEGAVKEAARHALQALRSPSDARIARTAAQIVVKVTALTTFEWWVASGLGDIPQTLLGDLLPAGELKTLAALYCLQYLMEDLPKQIGASSELIVKTVSELVLSQSSPLAIRKAGFRMCFNIYEQASLLDWNVEHFSPLQEGLMNASYFCSQVCTSLLEGGCEGDMAFMVLVLRCCALLYDYFDYFPQITPDIQQRLTQLWINNSAQIVCTTHAANGGNQEAVAAAIDLISTAVDLYVRNEEQTVLRFMVAGVPALIPKLVPALVQHSLLSAEEVANILENDDYRIRDSTAVTFHIGSGTKDISQDDMLDEDAAAMTLRSSALKCMDCLSTFASTAMFESVIGRIQQLWSSSDWREREAGVVLVGTIANGCARELHGVLLSLVPQIVDIINNASEHICVVSIAEWTLSQLSDSIVASLPAAINSVIPPLCLRLQSTSKRVQLTTVTALTKIYSVITNYGNLKVLAPFAHELLEATCSCLSVYSTNNLAVLVDFVTKLMAVVDEAAAMDKLAAVLQAERASRAAAFEASYIALYVSSEPNVLLNKDVFSLDRAVIALLAYRPNVAVATQNLTTWSNVLVDVKNRGVTDDADLVFNTLFICSAYVSSVPTAALGEWVRSTSLALPAVTVHILNTTVVSEVRVAAVTVLSSLVQILGNDALPPGTLDAVLTKATQDLSEAEDPQLKEINVQLICLIASKCPGQISTAVADALQAANGALRSDVFGESVKYFAQMAFDLCRVLETFPDYVSSFQVNTIAQLMTMSSNTHEKSDATIPLFHSLLQVPADVLRNYLPAIMKVVYSWQQAAGNYPGTREAIQQFLRHASSVCPSEVQSLFQGLPGPFCQMIMSLYQ